MSTEEQKIPTREEMIAFYEEQMPLLEAQLKYTVIRKEIQEAEAARIEAVAKIAYFQTNMHKQEAPQGDAAGNNE